MNSPFFVPTSSTIFLPTASPPDVTAREGGNEIYPPESAGMT
jgi:hypothetical protein